jgi:hypothetical protein
MKKFNEKFNLIMEEAHIEENASYEVIVNRISYIDDYNEGEIEKTSDEIVFEETTKNLKRTLEEIAQMFNLPSFSSVPGDNWFKVLGEGYISHNRMEDISGNIIDPSDENNKEIIERWKDLSTKAKNEDKDVDYGDELYAVYFEIRVTQLIKKPLEGDDIENITGFKFSE